MPYVLRQVKTWTKQFRAAETEKINDMEMLIENLPRLLPLGIDISLTVYGVQLVYILGRWALQFLVWCVVKLFLAAEGAHFSLITVHNANSEIEINGSPTTPM